MFSQPILEWTGAQGLKISRYLRLHLIFSTSTSLLYRSHLLTTLIPLVALRLGIVAWNQSFGSAFGWLWYHLSGHALVMALSYLWSGLLYHSTDAVPVPLILSLSLCLFSIKLGTCARSHFSSSC